VRTQPQITNGEILFSDIYWDLISFPKFSSRGKFKKKLNDVKQNYSDIWIKSETRTL
jgi:hypothetical protein